MSTAAILSSNGVAVLYRHVQSCVVMLHGKRHLVSKEMRDFSYIQEVQCSGATESQSVYTGRDITRQHLTNNQICFWWFDQCCRVCPPCMGFDLHFSSCAQMKWRLLWMWCSYMQQPAKMVSGPNTTWKSHKKKEQWPRNLSWREKQCSGPRMQSVVIPYRFSCKSLSHAHICSQPFPGSTFQWQKMTQ